MKTIALALLSLALGVSASAAPYFRVIGRPGYVRQVTSEFCYVPGLPQGQTKQSCTSVPLIEHSQRDGYLLIPGEDWSPLTIGGAFGGGLPLITVGPAANLSPALKAAVLAGLNVLAPDSFANLKAILAPPPACSGPDVTINLGAKWGFLPNYCRGGKGVYLLSVGPSFSF